MASRVSAKPSLFEDMAAALASGGQVLFALPKIALTAGVYPRRKPRRLEPAQWHSDSAKERERVCAASLKRAKIVGARSPFSCVEKTRAMCRLELRALQPEMARTNTPRHGRLYGAIKIPGLLSSATPSMRIVNADVAAMAM